ncbi:uncharacterized protein LOC134076890 isoform X2 [Sardina pilchardus]
MITDGYHSHVMSGTSLTIKTLLIIILQCPCVAMECHYNSIINDWVKDIPSDYQLEIPFNIDDDKINCEDLLQALVKSHCLNRGQDCLATSSCGKTNEKTKELIGACFKKDISCQSSNQTYQKSQKLYMLVNSTNFREAIECCHEWFKETEDTVQKRDCSRTFSSPGTTSATSPTRNTFTTSTACTSTTTATITTSTASHSTTTATTTTSTASQSTPVSTPSIASNTTTTSSIPSSTVTTEKETATTSYVHSSSTSEALSRERLSVVGFLLMVSVILNIVFLGFWLKQRHRHQPNTQPYRHCTCEGNNTYRLNDVPSESGSVI